MKTEDECPKNGRFLIADAYLSDDAIKLWQKETEKRFLNRVKDEIYFNFINWNRKENEIAIYTLYAFADLPLNKKFDCIFDYNNPQNFLYANFKIKQSIYEGWAPINTIEDGHKHLLILEFEEKIPSIIYKMHKEEKLQNTLPKEYVRLGFCNSENINEIIKPLTIIKILKEKYGKNWLEYYKPDE